MRYVEQRFPDSVTALHEMNDDLTFSLLYDVIVEEWSNSAVWRRLSLVFFALFLFVFIVGGLIVCFSRPEEIYTWLGKTTILFSLPFSILLACSAVLFLVFNAARSAYDEAPRIAAWLLVSEYRPYLEGRGLNSFQINSLKQIAEAEQGSADWRSGFVTIFVLGIFLSGALKILNLLESDYVRHYIGIALGVFRIEMSCAGLPSPVTDVSSKEWAILTLVGLALLSLAWIFTAYVYRFLSREHANRVILTACVEALEILRAAGLDGCHEITFWERGALISYLGYELVPIGKTSRKSPERIDVVTDPNGVEWKVKRREPLRKIWLEFIIVMLLILVCPLPFLSLQGYVSLFRIVVAGLVVVLLLTAYAFLRYGKKEGQRR